MKLIRGKISSQNNWEIFENYLESRLSNVNGLFISFIEMVFYKNPNIVINEPWIGILHDPHNTREFLDYSNLKNLFNRINFLKSLKYCKGIICMSEELKQYVDKKLNGIIPTMFSYHPISSKQVEQWDIKEFLNTKRVIQCGNWLRRVYSIYKLKTNNKKGILPVNIRLNDELRKCLKYDNIQITVNESKLVEQICHIDDRQYIKLFKNNIFFLNLYNSTCNNMIIECMKGNTPLIVNRLPAIEQYLGKEYPLFYDTMDEASKLSNSIDKIVEAHEYLKKLDKSMMNRDTIIHKINQFIEQNI